jgi:DnaK suppressor protein
MTDVERKQFLRVLQAKEAEVAEVLGRRDGLAVQSEADVFDEIQDALDRALLVRNLDHGSCLLREVRDAVHRIGNGQYGRCEECGEEINPKRLAALPWAALCLRCQEQSDSRTTEAGEWPQAPLTSDLESVGKTHPGRLLTDIGRRSLLLPRARAPRSENHS